MKLKKITSVLLSIIMLMGVLEGVTFAQNGIAVYITISKDGRIVLDKDDNEIALSKLELLNEEDTYTLCDAFLKAHEMFYQDGASGFSTSDGIYGTYVSKFWGDDSGNFGYQVNGGEDTVMGPDHKIKNGDNIDFVIYENQYPNTENYTKFDNYKLETRTDVETKLSLSVAGYDEFWNMVFSPCADAEIAINGKKSGIKTDENGDVEIVFDEAGEYNISAIKTKEIKEKTATAITAPICVVKVKDTAEMVINNIAKRYSGNEICTDANMPWFLADMGMYKKLYPKSKNVLSTKTKQTCLDKLIAFSEETNKPSDLAKIIIALRSMEYDPQNVYNKYSEKIDIVGKLLTQVDDKDENVINSYTLPYVIIALREYANEEQIEYLIDSAINKKEEWKDTTYGPDGATPMFVALSPYYKTNETVKVAIDEAVPLVKTMQKETGLIDSMGAAASTGLAIAGFSALSIDPKNIINGNKNLVNGIMRKVNKELDGFLPDENSFSTEQGFRGLIALKLFEKGKTIYDFSGYEKNMAFATVEKTNSSSGNGGGSFIAPKKTENEEIVKSQEVSKKASKFSDVKEDAWYFESVNFVENKGLMSGTDNGFEPEIPVTRAMLVSILFRMEKAENNKTEKVFKDIETNSWYFDAVNWAAQNGIVMGKTYDEFCPNDNITREQLAVILYRYVKFKKIDTETFENCDIMGYNDVSDVSNYAISAQKWAVGNGLIKGETESTLNPKNQTTRAQIAAILMRFCNMQGETK